MSRVITYGRFDIFHVGHLNLLEYCKKHGDYLAIGLSSDEYAQSRGKACVNKWYDRYRILASNRLVDFILPEMSYWDEKEEEIKCLKIETVVLGEEYQDQAVQFSRLCQVVIHKRTPLVSSSLLKTQIS